MLSEGFFCDVRLLVWMTFISPGVCVNGSLAFWSCTQEIAYWHFLCCSLFASSANRSAQPTPQSACRIVHPQLTTFATTQAHHGVRPAPATPPTRSWPRPPSPFRRRSTAAIPPLHCPVRTLQCQSPRRRSENATVQTNARPLPIHDQPAQAPMSNPPPPSTAPRRNPGTRRF